MEILEQLRLNLLEDTESTPERSPLSARESRASRTALREKVWAILTSVTSNKSICELSENLNRNGRSLKIRQVYSQGKISDTSIEYWTTFPRWGILSHGECGELLTSEPRTSEREFLLLPTPTASDGIAYAKISKKDVQACIYKQHHPKNRGKKSDHTKRLMEYLAFLGTPLSRICDLQEMIMGFPRGWTDLEVSEMR